MKLYTEEQLIKAIVLAQNCHHNCDGVYFDYNATDLINEFIPITVPSDEEIELESNRYEHFYTFFLGAKWMRDKIKGGQDE